MAVETVAELYYQLGLDTANLNKGFIDAQKTVNQNMRMMNSQEALIKLRADVQIQGLGENINATEALKIRQEELAQRLELAREKVELTSAAYEQMKMTQGENAEVSQLLAIQLEKERLVMAKLEQQTRQLNDQQRTAIGVQWELLGLIEPAMKGLKGLAGGASTLGRFSLLHVQIGTAVAMGLAAIVAGSKQATDELEEENIAKLLDDEFANAQINISNSLDTINQKSLQTARNMNAAYMYNAQREVTNEDYISDFLRIESILTDESDSLSSTLKNIAANTNYMNTELGKTIGLTIGLVKSFQALQKASLQWVTPAVQGFTDLQKKAQEMKVSLPVASDIVNAINLANGDYDDVRDYVRGVQDAVIKGTADDPEVLAIERYGVAIQDAKGNLLPFNEALENLYQGFLKAKEAGEEEAYIIMTNGQSVHDILPFFENYADAKQKINSIKWGTSDYSSLKDLSQNMKLAETQVNEFKTALSSLGIPLANYSAESDFNFYKKLTKIIDENRETILYWEFVFVEALKKAEDFADETITSIIEKFKELKDSEILEDVTGVFDNIINAVETITAPGRYLANIPYEIVGNLIGSDDTSATSKILEDAQKDLETYISVNEKARAETEKTGKATADGLSYSINRIRQYESELADIQLDLKFGDNNYEKELAQLEQWREEKLRNAKYYQAEQDAIEKLAWAKHQILVEQHYSELERLEREKAERIADIRRSINSNFQTDLQNTFDNIDYDKKSWIKNGLPEDEAEVSAQKLKAKAIEDFNRDVVAKVDAIWQSNLEKRLAEIEREKQAWIKKGVDEVKAEKWAEKAKADALLEYEKDIQEKQKSLSGQEKQIGEKQAEISKLYKERDKIYSDFAKRAEETSAQIQSIWDTELNNQLKRIEKEKQAYLQKGVDEVAAAKWAAQSKVDAERNAAMQILKTQLKAYKEFQTGGYNALKRYELNQLYKQGISKQDLNMTPEKLNQFKFAQKAVQNSLMPNFTTSEDFRRETAAKSGSSNFNLPSVEVSMTKEELDQLKNNSEQIEKANEEIKNLSKEIAEARAALIQAANINTEDTNKEDSYFDMQVDGKPVDTQLIKEIFGELPANLKATDNLNDTYQTEPKLSNDFNSLIEPQTIDTSNINSKIDELNPKIENVSGYFESLASKTSGVVETFSNLADQINKLDFKQNSAPPNITNNVSINEAHAWDYSHIRDLAEKVAAIITPQVVKAVGGNPNGY